MAEGTSKGINCASSIIQYLVGVEKLDDLATYEHKVWLVTSFQLHLDILNILQCDKNFHHLGIVCTPNTPRCQLVS